MKGTECRSFFVARKNGTDIAETLLRDGFANEEPNRSEFCKRNMKQKQHSEHYRKKYTIHNHNILWLNGLSNTNVQKNVNLFLTKSLAIL